MNYKFSVRIMLIVLVAISIVGCNLPASKSAVTATATKPKAPPPTATQPPQPTDTVAPPPTATPEVLVPTATIPLPPTVVPPTATRTKVPTQVSIKPTPRAKFSGTFEYGTISFRIDSSGSMIIPKSVSVKKGPCKESGKTASDTVAFDASFAYPIVDARFSISISGEATISGQFLTSKTAGGSLTLYFKNCTVGSYSWSAKAEE